MRSTSGSGDIMDIILIGFGTGFGLHCIASLIGYTVRSLFRFFNRKQKL